jgi:hypothetical protein
MIRVHVICEGQTEEMFVNTILAEIFLSKGICLLATLVGKPGHKGGNFKFERLLTDVRTRLLGDKTAYCTTFFDFYALPEDFPGKQAAKTKRKTSDKAGSLTEGLVEGLEKELGAEPLRRFIPYVQMYEFEGLLFSGPAGLASAINQSTLELKFQKIRDSFDSPEEINDSPMTAPSKRIAAVFSEYDKVVHGSLAAMEISLDAIRQECRLFDGWLKRIEALAPGATACV